MTNTAAVPLKPTLLPGTHAYAQKSVAAGETVQFRISSVGPYRFSIVRLGWDVEGPSRDWTIQQFPERPGAVQPIRSGSYVHVPPALPAAAFPSMSLECWVRPWLYKWEGLIGQYSFPTNCGCGLFLDSLGRPACYFGDGSNYRAAWLVTANISLPLKQWTHIVAVFNQGATTLWVNGERKASMAGGPSVVNPGSAPLRLAAYGDSGFTGNCLDGDLAMPVIYQRALSDAEIQARALALPPIVPSGGGLLGCWPMTEENGQSLADVSPHGRHGQIINRATWMIGGPGFDAGAIDRFGSYIPSADRRRGHALRFASEDLFDCRWSASVSYQIPSDLPPGIYVGRIHYGDGFSERYDVTFIVRRGASKPKARILVLCSTNTWLAYNVFFPQAPNAPGFNLYENYRDPNDQTGQNKLFPTYQMGLLMPWSAFPYTAYGKPDYAHLVRAERPLHVWLEQNGYDYDLASDLDLHNQPTMLKDYKAVVINGHSEYWSAQAYNAVDSYLKGNGRVIVLSGNTMFWRVSFDPAGEVMECRKLPTGLAGGRTDEAGEIYHSHDGARGGLMRESGYPAWRVIGLESVGYGHDQWHYTVQNPEHPFFKHPEATGLASGQVLGNGGEVYHEYDVRLSQVGGAFNPPPLPGAQPQLLAQSASDALDVYWDYRINTVASAVLSEVIDWQRDSGGRVFAAGSIAIGSKLSASPTLSTLLRNVLHHFGLAHRLNLFAVNAQGKLQNKWWDGEAWGPSMTGWQDLGGNFQSPPATVNWAPDCLALMGIEPDGRLQYKAWNGVTWLPSVVTWQDLRGQLKGTPCAVGWGQNRLHLFAQGMDNKIYTKHWDGAQWLPSVTTWQDLGGAMYGSPAAIAWHGNRLSVAAIGQDRRLKYKWFDGTNWNPSLTGWQDLGGANFTYGPAMISWGGNRINIFAVDSSGILWNKWWDGSSWGPSFTDWQSLGGGGIQSAPVAVARNSYELSIFVIGANNRMQMKWWDGSSWRPSSDGWQDMGGNFAGTPAAATWRGKYASLMGVGADGRFRYKFWDGSQWSPAGTDWSDLSGPLAGQLRASPSALFWIGKR